jgi:hypothetical protein
MARPKCRISPSQVRKLAELGATHQEIAEFFGVERSTISKRFFTEIRKGRAEVKIKLRRLQMRAAEKGNVTMLVWLGKNLLGQSDKTTDLTSDGRPVTPIGLFDDPDYVGGELDES